MLLAQWHTDAEVKPRPARARRKCGNHLDGLPPDALDRILGRLTRPHFASGTIVIAEGDRLHEMYIVEARVADLKVADRRGSSHHVNQVVTGDVLGEMSLFTGRPP